MKWQSNNRLRNFATSTFVSFFFTSAFRLLFLHYHFSPLQFLRQCELVIRDVTVSQTWNIATAPTEMSPPLRATSHPTQSIWIRPGTFWQSSLWASLGHFGVWSVGKRITSFLWKAELSSTSKVYRGWTSSLSSGRSLSQGVNVLTELVLAHNYHAILESRTSENLDCLVKLDLSAGVMQHIMPTALSSVFCVEGECRAGGLLR